jgi:hypothetical protein
MPSAAVGTQSRACIPVNRGSAGNPPCDARDGYGEDPFGRFGRSFDGYVEDEAVKGAQIPKPSAGNDDTAIVVATFCCATVRSRPRRPPIQEEAPPFAGWRDYDPSRIALLHGNGDFGQRAWRDHAELPDSAAELPVGSRGGHLARRFRSSRSGRDRSPYRQAPESGSDHTETICTTLHRRSETH